MFKKKLTLPIALGVLVIQGTFANEMHKDIEEFDLDSIEFIEEEDVISLGFDTADYLPEDFDAHAFYFDINSVEFIEESDMVGKRIKNRLPKYFDPYANPEGIEGINYIDPNDDFNIDFNTKKYLPVGFDAYKRV